MSDNFARFQERSKYQQVYSGHVRNANWTFLISKSVEQKGVILFMLRHVFKTDRDNIYTGKKYFVNFNCNIIGGLRYCK